MFLVTYINKIFLQMLTSSEVIFRYMSLKNFCLLINVLIGNEFSVSLKICKLIVTLFHTCFMISPRSQKTIGHQKHEVNRKHPHFELRYIKSSIFRVLLSYILLFQYHLLILVGKPIFYASTCFVETDVANYDDCAGTPEKLCSLSIVC